MISAHIANRYWPTRSRLIDCCAYMVLLQHAAVSPLLIVEGRCDVRAAPVVACMLEMHVPSFFFSFFISVSSFYFIFLFLLFHFRSRFMCLFFTFTSFIYLCMFEVYVFFLYTCMLRTILTIYVCLLGAVHLYFFFFRSFLSLLPFSFLISIL